MRLFLKYTPEEWAVIDKAAAGLDSHKYIRNRISFEMSKITPPKSFFSNSKIGKGFIITDEEVISKIDILSRRLVTKQATLIKRFVTDKIISENSHFLDF